MGKKVEGREEAEKLRGKWIPKLNGITVKVDFDLKKLIGIQYKPQ